MLQTGKKNRIFLMNLEQLHMTELLNENYTKTIELHVHYSLTVNILVLDARQSKTKYFFECVCTTVFFTI